ncbi:MAG: hypothetical protein GC159_09245 [Phycisphaera sp.]|nr:hypothetical protein [Phycisphaera sp.]
MTAPTEPTKLVVIILDQPQLIDELLTGFLDIGVRGATVIESRGMGAIVRQDMPVFAGLADLFGENTGSRMIFSVMPESLIDPTTKLLEEITGHLNQPNSAIIFSLPVEQFRGIKH